MTKGIDSVNDMSIVEEINELIEDMHLATQKSISLANLEIDLDEAFEEPLKIMDKIKITFSNIKSDLAKTIALSNVHTAIEEFEKKLDQV